LGIVTNGSRLERVAEVAGLLEKRDWLRLSLDAASQETFDKLHRPKKPVSLPKILKNARDIKARNPNVSLGYSYVIMWDGLSLNGHPIAPNLQEMPEAAELAAAYDFDYISFKPCLIRLPDVQRETLLDSVEKEKEQRIIDNIRQTLEDTRNAVDGRIKVLESVNLVAMVNNKVHELKKQPETCHMQIFNTVVTPMGIYHCPAFRGVENAKIAGPDGYAGEERFNETLQRLTDSITSFNATRECNRIACFYNHVNWWIENFIESEKSVDELEEAEDDNFFF